MSEHVAVQAADQPVNEEVVSSTANTAPGASLDAPSPIAEARRYRKRAQAAERAAADLRLELQQKSAELAEREQTITALERRQRIDELLLEARAIDLDTARLLTELAVADMPEPDLDAAVAELRSRKPFLFRAGRASSGALAPRSAPDGAASAASPAQRAAAEAHATGRRADLLRYLRLRRRR
jgi:hypothetical protein